MASVFGYPFAVANLKTRRVSNRERTRAAWPPLTYAPSECGPRGHCRHLWRRSVTAALLPHDDSGIMVPADAGEVSKAHPHERALLWCRGPRRYPRAYLGRCELIDEFFSSTAARQRIAKLGIDFQHACKLTIVLFFVFPTC